MAPLTMSCIEYCDTFHGGTVILLPTKPLLAGLWISTVPPPISFCVTQITLCSVPENEPCGPLLINTVFLSGLLTVGAAAQLIPADDGHQVKISGVCSAEVSLGNCSLWEFYLHSQPQPAAVTATMHGTKSCIWIYLRKKCGRIPSLQVISKLLNQSGNITTGPLYKWDIK